MQAIAKLIPGTRSRKHMCSLIMLENCNASLEGSMAQTSLCSLQPQKQRVAVVVFGGQPGPEVAPQEDSKARAQRGQAGPPDTSKDVPRGFCARACRQQLLKKRSPEQQLPSTHHIREVNDLQEGSMCTR
jgi:hypothetical protein